MTRQALDLDSWAAAQEAADGAVAAVLARLHQHLAGAPLGSVRLAAFTDRVDWEVAYAAHEPRHALEETIRQRINGLARYLDAMDALEALLDALYLAVRARELQRSACEAVWHDYVPFRAWLMRPEATTIAGMDEAFPQHIRHAFARELLRQKFVEIRQRSPGDHARPAERAHGGPHYRA